MTTWRDDLLDITKNCSNWVEDNFDKFFGQEKSTVEYYQMSLFDSDNRFLTNLALLLKIYNPLDEEKSEDIYFRKIEYLAFEELSGENRMTQIKDLAEQGFLCKLMNRNIPLDIISNRDYLYIITHDIFYTSVFGKNKQLIRSIYNNKKELVVIFMNAILIAIRHYDTDVLMELLCCLYILDIVENIPEYILEMIVTFLKRYQLPNGSIPSDVSIKNPTFEEVYHTCLAASILYYCMEGI